MLNKPLRLYMNDRGLSLNWLAGITNLSRHTVKKWGEYIPAEHVQTISDATDGTIQPHELNSKVFRQPTSKE